MAKKITFVMGAPAEKKHSVQFHYVNGLEILDGKPEELETVGNSLRNASFYIPKPFAETSKKIRVTIETLE